MYIGLPAGGNSRGDSVAFLGGTIFSRGELVLCWKTMEGYLSEVSLKMMRKIKWKW